jgi:tetratricopeptide (TPR) repeat protein
MKKIKLLLAISVVAGTLSAQNPKVNNAFNYLRKGNLSKAKDAIDEASEHQDTKDAAKTWFYKGNIYLAISASEDPEVSGLDTAALEKSYEYYQKSITIDKEISNDMLNISNPFDGIKMVANIWFIKGRKYFDEKNFYRAYYCYNKSYEYTNPKDDNAAYMAAICGINYDNTRDMKKDTISLAKETKSYLVGLTNRGFKDEFIYSTLANLYMTDKDTAKAVSVANKAEKQFPDSSNTLLLKLSVYYWAGKTADANVLRETIKGKYTKNPLVFFNMGNILEKTNFEESEKAFLMAIDLNPTYFDAIFNLGALYFNKYVDIKKNASNIKDDAEYTKAIEKSKEYITKARPYVEKCYAMNAQDYNTIFMLKLIYANSNELEKVKEMDALLLKIKK